MAKKEGKSKGRESGGGGGDGGLKVQIKRGLKARVAFNGSANCIKEARGDGDKRMFDI